MIHTLTALGGMFVAPHHLAAQAGRDVLRDGGNAVEAMVAAAAAIAVVYPHMNAIGGDGFWLIHEPGQKPVAISACGPAAALADLDWYAGHSTIPSRGPKAALTVAGTIGGWAKAREVAAPWGPALPLSRLLADGIRHAHNGIAVTESQAALTREKFDGLKDAPGFAQTHLVNGQPPAVGHILKQPTLGRTLEQLAERGLDDFYRGEIAQRIGAELERVGSPLRTSDLAAYQAQIVEPLSVRLNDSTVYNLPPPTQGLSALMILGLFERLGVTEGEGFAHVHGLVEATKRAFRVRERVVTDPQRAPADPKGFLKPAALAELAAEIDRDKALPWPDVAKPGDTIWMGCIDAQGRAV
ncbi:MAG: gamma-glutamyltransferase, partial [Hydrogenophaga sp.]